MRGISQEGGISGALCEAEAMSQIIRMKCSEGDADDILLLLIYPIETFVVEDLHLRSFSGNY